jgi:uncharacterized membrane protein YeaQ/YmgE (transglycosylase-associated protein family)
MECDWSSDVCSSDLLIAGAIAKAILPDKQGGGWLSTLILGMIGALVGGWIGSLLGLGSVDEFFSIGTWLLAIGGSILVILLWGLITRKR